MSTRSLPTYGLSVGWWKERPLLPPAGDHVICGLGLLGAADYDDVIDIYFFFRQIPKNSVLVVQGKRERHLHPGLQ